MRWGHHVVIRIFQIASNNSIKTNDFEYQTLLVNFLLQSDMADEIVTKMRYSFEKRNRLVLIDLSVDGRLRRFSADMAVLPEEKFGRREYIMQSTHNVFKSPTEPAYDLNKPKEMAFIFVIYTPSSAPILSDTCSRKIYNQHYISR